MPLKWTTPQLFYTLYACPPGANPKDGWRKMVFWGIRRKAHIYFGSIVMYNQETVFPVRNGYQGNFPTIFKEMASTWQHFMIFSEQLAEISYWCNDNRILLRHLASQSSPLDCTIYIKTSYTAKKAFKPATTV